MNIRIPRSDRRRIVIVGGGFGGLKLARRLVREGRFQIVLIDRNNFHQFPPLIYQVATAGMEPSSISFPFRRIFRQRRECYFRMAEVLEILPSRNLLRTSVGEIGYDLLVLAAGAASNFFGMEEIERQAMPMKTVSEAMGLRNTLLTYFERALTCATPEERDELLDIVVVGGGATGVEIAGALSEMKRFVLPRDYPDLPADKMHVRLLEAGDRLLAGMSASASRHAEAFLRRMGVEVTTGAKVTGYRNNRVILADGTAIPTRALIWVSGVKAESIPGLDPALIGRGGRIRVDAFNRVEGLGNVFAIGDQCLMTADPSYPDGHPQLAQVAIQQSRRLADNLLLAEQGRPMRPFRYRNLRVMATIGRNRAVADFARVHIHGWAAWIIWLVVHLRSILGVKNKLFVLQNWVWNYFTYDQSLRMIVFARLPRSLRNRLGVCADSKSATGVAPSATASDNEDAHRQEEP